MRSWSVWDRDMIGILPSIRGMTEGIIKRWEPVGLVKLRSRLSATAMEFQNRFLNKLIILKEMLTICRTVRCWHWCATVKIMLRFSKFVFIIVTINIFICLLIFGLLPYKKSQQGIPPLAGKTLIGGEETSLKLCQFAQHFLFAGT